MNITGYSPLLTLIYVFFLLSILMGVNYQTFDRKQRWYIGAAVAFLCVGNHLLCHWIGSIAFSRVIIVSMHLPMFLLFLYIGKRGVIKTFFMILTAVVFTTPTILIGNLMRRTLFADSSTALLLTSIISCVLMLLLAQFVFRSSFNYLIKYASNQFFLLFSLVPLVFYTYVLAIMNLDVSALSGSAGYIIRYMPTLNVFLLYFLLPYVYKSLSEKHATQSAQDALQQKLTSADEHISLLSETNRQMEVYRHDIRHQLIVLDGLLASEKNDQAHQFVKTAMNDLDSVTPKKFCENETINLLCSSYDKKALNSGIAFTVNARLPKALPLSDTELCSVVSNALENALRAASNPQLSEKWISLYSETKQNKLLIQIKNTYSGQVNLENGIPISHQEGHGYGCHSIQAIAERNHGLCSFEAQNGVFTLRLIIPLR